MPDPELRHLRYFVAVAEELHFGRAARRLRIEQPTLSQQVRRLEQLVGTALLSRTSRRVELTTAGRAFLERARGALAEVERCVRAVREPPDRETLRLGFTGYAAGIVLPHLLRDLGVRLPSVEISLFEDNSHANTESLLRGDLDAALVSGDAAAAESSIFSLTMLREPLVAAVPASHPLAARRSVPLASLAAEGFVQFPRAYAPDFHDDISAACRVAGFTPKVRYQAAGYGPILDVVAGGRAIALVPASVARRRRREVRFRRLTGTRAAASTTLISSLAPASPALAALLDAAHAFVHRAQTRREGHLTSRSTSCAG